MPYYWTSPNHGVKAIEAGDPINRLADLLGGESRDRLTPERAYLINAWFRRCVDERADALASIPYTVARGGEVVYDTGGFDPVPKDLAWFSDGDALLRLVETALVLTGRAYARPIVERGRLKEVEWISPILMEPLYGPNGEIVTYRRTLTNRQGQYSRDYPASQIVAFFERDPFTEVGPGAAVAQAARVNVDVLQSLDIFLDGYMDRGLLPAAIVSVPATTSPQERAGMQRWWDKYYRGKDNAGRVRVVNADAVKVEKIGDGIGALGASEVVKQQREAIAVALGVPMSRLADGASGRGGAMADDQAFYVKTVIPRAKRIQADLTRQLFAPQGLFFQFQFKRIEALQRALLETARGIQRLVEGPVMTQNEGRLFLGMKPVENDPHADELGDMDEQAPAALSQEASTLAVQEATTKPEERRRAMPPEWEDELGKWRRKLEKKGLDAPFTPDHLPPRIEGAIRQRLRLGEPLEDAFRPPFLEY